MDELKFYKVLKKKFKTPYIKNLPNILNRLYITYPNQVMSKIKIYKYASVNSGIKILKNENVLLNKATSFNDPYDCAFKEVLANSNIIKKKAMLKCLLFISLKFELDVDNLIIFLLCYKQIHKVSNEKLAALLEIKKENLINIILGNKKVGHLDKIKYCNSLNINYLEITKEVNALFNC